MKIVSIDLPEGVEAFTPEEIVLAPHMAILDLPIFASMEAPDLFEINVEITEQRHEPSLRSIDSLLKTTMQINVALEKYSLISRER